MTAILCSSVDEARTIRDQLDVLYGYPRPGTNAATGDPVPPGGPGWTATCAEILDIGGAAYVCGVTDAMAAAICRSTVEAQAGIGTVYALEIDRWAGDAPILVERSRARTPPPEDITRAKADAIRIIADRSATARAVGFLHSDGRRYTLEHDACRQIMEAKSWALYDEGHGTSYMAYPLIWPSVDRSGFVAMQTAADVVAFALSYSLADRALTEQMAGLEMSIALAETVDDITRILGAA